MDRTEYIGEYKTFLWDMEHLELRWNSRTEHLKARNAKKPQFPPRLAVVNADEEETIAETMVKQMTVFVPSLPPPSLNIHLDHDTIHVGRPMIMREHKRILKARLWMYSGTCSFPLSLKELKTILDLFGWQSHMTALKDVLNCQLPQGFPIQLEIPLFQGFSARIGFEPLHDAAISFELPKDYRKGIIL